MKRAKLRGLKRNAAVVLGNIANADDVPVLVAALDDPERLVREHAEWALRQIRQRRAHTALVGAHAGLAEGNFIEGSPAPGT